MLFLSEPLPLTSTCASVLHPWGTSPWSCVSHLMSPTRITCHTMGTARGGGLPPSGPILCLARGGERSGSEGRSKSKPSPVTPPRYMPNCAMTEVSKPDMYKDLLGVGGGGSCAAPLVPPHAVPAHGLSGTSPSSTNHTLDSVRTNRVFPDG